LIVAETEVGRGKEREEGRKEIGAHVGEERWSKDRAEQSQGRSFPFISVDRCML